jgi:hypothetical protein
MKTSFNDVKKLASEIATTYNSKSNRLPELLHSYYKNNYAIPGLNFEKLSVDGNYLDPNVIGIELNSESLNFLLDIIDNKTANFITDYLGKDKLQLEYIQIPTIDLYTIIQTLEEAGYKVLAAIKPQGVCNLLFVFKNEDDVIPFYLIQHFLAGIGNFGVFQDWNSDFNDMGYNLSFNDYFESEFKGRIDKLGNEHNKLTYKLEKSDFGYLLFENLEMLNLNSYFFELSKQGILLSIEYPPK